MKTYYRPLEEGDIPTILQELDLRKSDQDELRAVTGLEPLEALRISLQESTTTFVVVHEGSIEAVFGITSSKEGYGIPWFLTSDKFSEFRITFTRESKFIVRAMLETYGILYNVVDSRHKDAIKWLRWLGFMVEEDRPLYFADPAVPFYPFFMILEKEGSP